MGHPQGAPMRRTTAQRPLAGRISPGNTPNGQEEAAEGTTLVRPQQADSRLRAVAVWGTQRAPHNRRQVLAPEAGTMCHGCAVTEVV